MPTGTPLWGLRLWAHRALAADIIGPHAGPRGFLGFTPTLVERDGLIDLELSSGAYYVDGIRCELPLSLLPPGRGAMPWNDQPYPVAVEAEDLPSMPYLIYLDVWERLVTTLDDDALRNVAVTGADTARRQVIWQVRVMPYLAADDAVTSDAFPLAKWRNTIRPNPPCLRATTLPPEGDAGLGAAGGGFTGAENHLYRVEIVSAGAGGDRGLFAWSRDNGSVAAEWTATEGCHLYVGETDDPRTFAPGDWIELTWESLEFARVPATRVRLVAVDGRVLTVDLDTASGEIVPDPGSRAHATIRRWDQRDTAATHLIHGAIAVPESPGEWIPLENGIWIEFDPGDASDPMWVGDYWTFSARTATADIDWPRDAAGEPYRCRHRAPCITMRRWLTSPTEAL